MPKRQSTNTLLAHAKHMAAAARLNGASRHEKALPPFYLRITKTDARIRLLLAHRDRQPSADEMTAVLDAAGAPLGTDWIATYCSTTNQDGTYSRLPGLVANWSEC